MREITTIPIMLVSPAEYESLWQQCVGYQQTGDPRISAPVYLRFRKIVSELQTNQEFLFKIGM